MSAVINETVSTRTVQFDLDAWTYTHDYDEDGRYESLVSKDRAKAIRMERRAIRRAKMEGFGEDLSEDL